MKGSEGAGGGGRLNRCTGVCCCCERLTIVVYDLYGGLNGVSIGTGYHYSEVLWWFNQRVVEQGHTHTLRNGGSKETPAG